MSYKILLIRANFFKFLPFLRERNRQVNLTNLVLDPLFRLTTTFSSWYLSQMVA